MYDPKAGFFLLHCLFEIPARHFGIGTEGEKCRNDRSRQRSPPNTVIPVLASAEAEARSVHYTRPITSQRRIGEEWNYRIVQYIPTAHGPNVKETVAEPIHPTTKNTQVRRSLDTLIYTWSGRSEPCGRRVGAPDPCGVLLEALRMFFSLGERGTQNWLRSFDVQARRKGGSRIRVSQDMGLRIRWGSPVFI